MIQCIRCTLYFDNINTVSVKLITVNKHCYNKIIKNMCEQCFDEYTCCVFCAEFNPIKTMILYEQDVVDSEQYICDDCYISTYYCCCYLYSPDKKTYMSGDFNYF